MADVVHTYAGNSRSSRDCCGKENTDGQAAWFARLYFSYSFLLGLDHFCVVEKHDARKKHEEVTALVVLDEPTSLPDGTRVTVTAVEPPDRSFLQRLGDVVGKVDGLPADAATNVDHYLYGQPKR